jgi:hypothetical protein
MHISTRFGAPIAILVASTSTGVAFGHNHLTVDTRAGAFGDPITVKAGYLGNESMFSIASGRLLYNGTMAVYRPPQRRWIPVGAVVGDHHFRRRDHPPLGFVGPVHDHLHRIGIERCGHQARSVLRHHGGRPQP